LASIEKGAPPSVAAAAKVFRTLCYENKDRLMAGVIVAGFDAAEGGSVGLVEVRPHTGRQHQIRVHLRSIGAPLLVDPLYGRCERIEAGGLGANAPDVPRLTLHAHGVTLRHPVLGMLLDIEAPLPADLAGLEAWMSGPA
jgi:23S rRNA-/tRNA-specific pseudouridylate synthase